MTTYKLTADEYWAVLLSLSESWGRKDGTDGLSSVTRFLSTR